MKNINMDLIGFLSSGEYRSGEDIGQSLGVSRAAVWKKLQQLEQYQLKVESVKGLGYRLSAPISLLDFEKFAQLSDSALVDVARFTPVLGSTNAELALLVDNDEPVKLLVSEVQTAGRGRRGRKWVSPFARNIYMSLAEEFYGGVSAIQGLSLVVGLSITTVLESLGVEGVELKWPNDVLVKGRKVAGVLIDLSGDPNGSCTAIIGVGVNVNLKREDLQSFGIVIDQQWTSLQLELGSLLDRTEFLVNLVGQMKSDMELFRNSGFNAFVDRWSSYDAFYNKDIALTAGNNVTFGVSKGVNEKGELLFESDGVVNPVSGGEVSLRIV